MEQSCVKNWMSIVLVSNQRDAVLFYLVYYHSTCFGRGSRPSSGEIHKKAVMAATSVCVNECGVK